MCAKPTSGVDPPGLLSFSAAGWSDQEVRWEHLCERAAKLATAGGASEAAPHWAEALFLARQSFAPIDPRLATSIANHAFALRLGGDSATAAELFREAMTIWDASGQWIAALRIERRARSSLFHLRMEAKHWKTYEATMRKRLELFAREGREALAALAEERAAASRGLSRWWPEKTPAYTDARKLLAAVLLIVRTNEIGAAS
ncbi:MAG: hypothetical protein ACREDZ_05570 [Kiloniellales bacterium]